MTVNKMFFPEQLQPISPINRRESDKSTGKVSPSSFDKILDAQNNQIKFSSHAQQRLKSRNIELGDQELSRLQGAMEKARAKGSRDSLIIMGDMALVVSVKNNTVITALDGESMKENVFTNIDSAVVV